MNIALIVLAGSGTRLNSPTPKQFLKVNDQDLVVYTIKRFNDNPHIDEIVLVTSKDYLPYVNEYKDKYNLEKIVAVIEGGASRQESVRLGLEATDYKEDDNILIHDGARPLVSNSIINQCVDALSDSVSCCPYICPEDEITEISNFNRKVILDGKKVGVQTPQGFKYGLIKKIHIAKKDIEVNDDISLLDNEHVEFFVGEPINFKVTTPEDLAYFEEYLKNH